MDSNGKLLVDGHDMLDKVAAIDRVNYVKGRVFTISRFGRDAAHAEICETKDMKSLRADAFVLCSGYYLIT